MPTIRMAIAGGVLALTTATGSGLSSCKPETSTHTPVSTTSSKPAKTKAQGEELRAGEREWKCDMRNHAFDVKPNTKKNRDDAEQSCQRTGKAIDEAPWPSGVSVVPLPH